MEKIFRATQGKRPSCVAWRCLMARYSVDINLSGDKWEVGGGAMSRGGTVGEQITLKVAAHFPLLCCPTHEK